MAGQLRRRNLRVPSFAHPAIDPRNGADEIEYLLLLFRTWQQSSGGISSQSQLNRPLRLRSSTTASCAMISDASEVLAALLRTSRRHPGSLLAFPVDIPGLPGRLLVSTRFVLRKMPCFPSHPYRSDPRDR